MLALAVLVHARCVNEGEKESKIMRHDWSNTTTVSSCFPPLFSNSPYDGMHCAVSCTNTSVCCESPIVQSGTNNKGYQFKWLVVFSNRVKKQSSSDQAHFVKYQALGCVCWPFEGNFFMLSMEFHYSRVVSSVLVRFIIRMEVLFWRREKISRKIDKKQVVRSLENFCGEPGKLISPRCSDWHAK